MEIDLIAVGGKNEDPTRSHSKRMSPVESWVIVEVDSIRR